MFTLSDIAVVRNHKTILSIEQLDIPTDQLTVVLGHNGSGKSTLVNLLAGQMHPDQGRIDFRQQDLSTLNAQMLARSIAFLPQKLPASAGLSVRELVRLGRYPWRGMLGFWRAQDKAVIDAAMARTGHLPHGRSPGG